jgi:NAD(P)-dependent dehydrogenase (short-subunit alcohol dehydrogenase family)
MTGVPELAPERRRAALVVGACGGLGAALVQALQSGDFGGEGRFDTVIGISRSSASPIDYAQPASVEAAARSVAASCEAAGADLRLIVVASGFLHGSQGQPERSWSHLEADYLQHVFLINAIGPALVMKHFLPLLPKQGRVVCGFISAKVGSIGDNALGGWYGYRASKAALNQLVKTAAIELARRNKQAVCVTLHPGTVATGLSEPFQKTGLSVRPASEAAADLLRVLAGRSAQDSGGLFDYRGERLPF